MFFIVALTVFLCIWKIMGIPPGPLRDLLVTIWRGDGHVPPGNNGDYRDLFDDAVAGLGIVCALLLGQCIRREEPSIEDRRARIT